MRVSAGNSANECRMHGWAVGLAGDLAGIEGLRHNEKHTNRDTCRVVDAFGCFWWQVGYHRVSNRVWAEKAVMATIESSLSCTFVSPVNPRCQRSDDDTSC